MAQGRHRPGGGPGGGSRARKEGQRRDCGRPRFPKRRPDRL